MTKGEIKKMIENAEICHALAMTSEDKDASDEAYATYWQHITGIAAAITEMTSGAIDAETAKKMAVHKPQQIKALFA